MLRISLPCSPSAGVIHDVVCALQTLLFALLLAGVALCSAAALSAIETEEEAVPVAEDLDQDGGDLEGSESHYRRSYYRPRYYR